MTLRLRPLTLAAIVAVAGCSRGEPAANEAATPVAAPVVAVVVAEETPAPVAPPVPPPVAAVPYRPMTDLGGRAVAAVTATTTPAPLPLPTVKTPRPRVSSIDRGELPATPPKLGVPALPLAPGKAARPSPPPEGLPADFGLATVQETGSLKLPVTVSTRPPTPAPPLTAGDLPRQAKQRPEKPTADDAVEEIVAARVVFTPLTRPFVREIATLLRLPDPFELAEQLRRQPTPPVAPADADARPVVVK